MKDEEVDEVEIREFCPEDLPLSFSMLAIGGPGSGKSNAIEAICHARKHLYPVARCFCGSETMFERMASITHPLYVTSRYEDDEEKQYIIRQKTCIRENGKQDINNYAINIIDDCSDNRVIFTKKPFQNLIKNCSRHGCNAIFIGTQYALDMDPAVRSSVNYVLVFRQVDDEPRRKIWRNFGGVFGSYERFCDALDQITEEKYTCMVINRRAESTKLEDCVFWYKAKNAATFGKWKLGCKEYHKHAEERYNKDYVDDIEL